MKRPVVHTFHSGHPGVFDLWMMRYDVRPEEESYRCLTSDAHLKEHGGYNSHCDVEEVPTSDHVQVTEDRHQLTGQKLRQYL